MDPTDQNPVPPVPGVGSDQPLDQGLPVTPEPQVGEVGDQLPPPPPVAEEPHDGGIGMPADSNQGEPGSGAAA